MKNLLLTITLLLSISNLITSQNLVLNSSFEFTHSDFTGEDLPTNSNGLGAQSYWDNYYGSVCSWEIPTKKRPCYYKWTTPDVLSNFSNSSNMNAHHGLNYARIIQEHEFLINELYYGLTPHEEYTFEFYVNTISSGSVIKPYVAVCRNKPKSCYTNFIWNGGYQIISSTHVTTSHTPIERTWTRVTGTFRASENHRYLVISCSVDSPIKKIFYDSFKIYKTGTDGYEINQNCGNSIVEETETKVEGKWVIGNFNGAEQQDHGALFRDDIFRQMNEHGGAEVFLSNGSSFNEFTLWSNAGNRKNGWHVGDFNGDGKDDIFRQMNEHGGAEVFLSNGSSFNEFTLWSNAGNRKNGWHVGDFNGDGKDDIFRQMNEHGGAEVFLSNGSSFNEFTLWSNAGNRKNGWHVGDFNGDGKDDIFRQMNEHGGAEVFLSNGSSFNEFTLWSNAGNRKNGWYIGDFNGDGKDDVLRQMNEHGGAEVFLSNGSGFNEFTLWSNAGNRRNGWHIGDFNGDGKDDIFRQMNEYGGAEVFLSTGSQFIEFTLWTLGSNDW